MIPLLATRFPSFFVHQCFFFFDLRGTMKHRRRDRSLCGPTINKINHLFSFLFQLVIEGRLMLASCSSLIRLRACEKSRRRFSHQRVPKNVFRN